MSKETDDYLELVKKKITEFPESELKELLKKQAIDNGTDAYCVDKLIEIGLVYIKHGLFNIKVKDVGNGN